MSTDKPKALFVVASPDLRSNLLPGEEAIRKRLAEGNTTLGAGYYVEIKQAQEVTALDTRDKVLVVISSDVSSMRLSLRAIARWGNIVCKRSSIKLRKILANKRGRL